MVTHILAVNTSQCGAASPSLQDFKNKILIDFLFSDIGTSILGNIKSGEFQLPRGISSIFQKTGNSAHNLRNTLQRKKDKPEVRNCRQNLSSHQIQLRSMIWKEMKHPLCFWEYQISLFFELFVPRKFLVNLNDLSLLVEQSIPILHQYPEIPGQSVTQSSNCICFFWNLVWQELKIESPSLLSSHWYARL